MTSDAPADLLGAAQAIRVAVVGASLEGLAAAREFAKVAMHVTVFEATDRLGGSVSSVDLDGVRIDLGADRFAATGAVSALAEELGLGPEMGPVPVADSLWIELAAGGFAPLPPDSLLGIPSNPWSPAARAFIGWRGAWRAYTDRLRPPLTIGHQRRASELVRSRMGPAVYERMLTPAVRARFGLSPDRLDIDRAAPGLNAALSRTGSLGGAVADILEPPAPQATVQGGLDRIVAALAASITELGGSIRTDAPVTAIARTGDAAWTIEVGDDVLAADILVVATNESDARMLLAPTLAVPEQLEAPSSDELVVVLTGAAVPERHQVTSASGDVTVIDVAAERSHPAPGAAQNRVLRVVAPRHPLAGTAQGQGLSEAERATAGRLLGIEIAAENVQFVHRQPSIAAEGLALGWAEVEAQRDAALRTQPTLELVGRWVTGRDLDASVDDARTRADALRTRVLWGTGEVPEAR